MSEMHVQALFGGIVIGVAVSIMLLFSGRVTGISGILNGLLIYKKGDMTWRFFFILGLIGGGIFLKFKGEVFNLNSFEVVELNLIQISVAGLLVGFGTIMGNGCTSGHGVCGISRLSIRSMLATITFIITGIATVYTLGA